MNGLRLGTMEASDMIDVLHYFFEDDMDYSTAEQAEARDKTRSSIYSNLYNSTYKYAQTSSTNQIDFTEVDAPLEQEKAPEPFNPAIKPKPFVAPTNFNPDSAKPFGSVLDAPLG